MVIFLFLQVVAPMTKVGDLHSQSSRSRAYAYVFEYQSKSSDYQQVKNNLFIVARGTFVLSHLPCPTLQRG